ncbi:hypothetical protein [Calothrix sp. NIES-2098]|uniref:hypothetical protein n=1 Tax=Calothrix sp. NIES-2098 TaxID=1954171 RepID=UPI000B5F918F|nr:hypothetical protein NIES2098_32320 [Calothrix sp. NIES-2098]
MVEAVNDFHKLKKRDSPSNLFRIFLLIHQLGGDYFAVLLGDETTPIIHFDDNSEIFIDQRNYSKKSAFFSSLTTLMYAIAECFKDAIYTETDSNGYISWEFDEDKVKVILHKYNTGNFKIYRA